MTTSGRRERTGLRHATDLRLAAADFFSAVITSETSQSRHSSSGLRSYSGPSVGTQPCAGCPVRVQCVAET